MVTWMRAGWVSFRSIVISRRLTRAFSTLTCSGGCGAGAGGGGAESSTSATHGVRESTLPRATDPGIPNSATHRS